MGDGHEDSFEHGLGRWPQPAKMVLVLTAAAVGATVGGILDAAVIHSAYNAPAWIGAAIVAVVATVMALRPAS